jgi:hypothetical protein
VNNLNAGKPKVLNWISVMVTHASGRRTIVSLNNVSLD